MRDFIVHTTGHLKWYRKINGGGGGAEGWRHERRNFKDINPLMSSSILFGVVGSEPGQKQSVKFLQNMVYSIIHPPPPLEHSTFSLGRGGGGEVREKIEGLVYPKGVGPSATLAWPGWEQSDIAVEVDTGRLETSRFKKCCANCVLL